MWFGDQNSPSGAVYLFQRDEPVTGHDCLLRGQNEGRLQCQSPIIFAFFHSGTFSTGHLVFAMCDPEFVGVADVCKNDPSTGLATTNCKTTTDLGQALIDGNFDHVGKIKGPILRGLSARAPYFHNGSAQSLLDAVRFYEKRFGLILTPQEESDLVAFLRSL